VVQVGSFTEQARADALVTQLRGAGLPAFSERVTSRAGQVYKVRIGPEINRDRAVELAARIKREHGLDAFVTTSE
jgi:DedD protein